MLRIGVIGMGRMGTPVCARLVHAGHAVTVHDGEPGREQAALARGAGWRASAAEVAAGSDVLLTVLPGAAEVEAVMGDAVLDAMAPGSTWIDLTSNSPTAVAPIRERARARGIGVLEAPIGGGLADAAAEQQRLGGGHRLAEPQQVDQ